MSVRVWRLVVAGAVCGVIGASVTAPAWGTAPDRPAAHTAGPPAAQASSALDAVSQRAVATRHPVVVDALTTATTQTTAEPDGSFTLAASAQPVRVRKPSGWVPVDTSLRRSDGVVATTATTWPLTFGAGGGTTLATVAVAGGSVSLSAPWVLPAPKLSGATATFPDVLPGVDLRLTAADTGFAEQLVIRSRAAAQNPALRRVAFGVQSTRVAVRASAGGRLTVLDGSGSAVLQSAPPMMWDATQRQRPVSAQAGPSSIVLTPDSAFLDAPGTEYPVTIDPDFHPTRTVWAKVFSGFPSQTYFNGGIDGAQAKVGACYVPSGECNGLGVARTYFQYDVSSLHDNGGLVKHAEFNVTQTFAASCTTKNIELMFTGSINNTTTWNTQPSGQLAGTIGSNCTNETDSKTYGYNVSALWPGKVGQTGVTFMLRASNEDDQLAWRKFTNSPSLIITYNRPPGTPTGLTTAGKPCATSAGAQVLNPMLQASGVRTVALSAKATDPDGQNVKITVSWFSGSTALGSSTSPFVTSGVAYTAAIPATQLTDGEVINWRAQATDGTDAGPVSASCFFTVDETSPSAAPSIASGDYPGTTDPQCAVAFAGGVGHTGTFTFGASGVGDVAGYVYGLNATPGLTARPSALGGTVSVSITPTLFGPNHLTVFSVDRAGNHSPQATYCFRVLSGKDAVHHWSLDGASTDQPAAPDQPVEGVAPLDATMVGLGAGGAWTAGRDGGAALFNGSLADYVQAASGAPGPPALDTTKTFAVSAWVRVDRLGNFPTAVSMDGVHAPAFQLQAQPDGHWAFVMMGSDVNGGGFNYRLVSKSSVVVGRWTQLIGGYDAGTQQMSIYVDGVLEATLAHPNTATWAAHGPVTIGRSMFDGAPSDPFTGAIDDVRLFDHAIEPTGDISDDTLTNAQNLATLPLQQQAWYDFEEGTGPVAADATANFNPATLGGGATRVDPGDSGLGSALRLDGSTGFAATAGPVVHTTTSFTVGAWVRIDDLGPDPMTFVSVDGAQTSNLALQYRDDGGTPTFAVQLAGSDVAAPAMTVVTGGAGQIDDVNWHYVAAAYNAVSGTLDLYVDGSPVGQSATRVTDSWAASGPLEIGRGRVAGQPAQYFAGDIDNVQVSLGAETTTEAGATFAAPLSAPSSPFAGELTRWLNPSAPTHITTSTGAVPPGFVFEGPDGALAPAGAADTKELYSCLYHGNDEFTSVDPNCEGQTLLGPLGPVFANAADTPNAVTLYRCSEIFEAQTYHFDSLDSACEGKTEEFVLGYLRPLANLVRYQDARSLTSDDPATRVYWSTVIGTDLPAGLTPQPNLGVDGVTAQVGLTALPGTVGLAMCQGSTGQYLAVQTCGTDPVIGGTGWIWTSQPAGSPSAQLYSCIAATGQRFPSLDPGCEGLSQQAPTVLGWVKVQA